MWYSHSSDSITWPLGAQPGRAVEGLAPGGERSREGTVSTWPYKGSTASGGSKLFIHVNGTDKTMSLVSESIHMCSKPHTVLEKIVWLSDASTKAEAARRALCWRSVGGSIKLCLYLQVTVYCLIFFPD